MDIDKQQHIAAGCGIAFLASLGLLLIGWYGNTVQIGNLPYPVWVTPLIIAAAAGYIREKTNSTGFSQADLYATIMGGMIGSAIVYTPWYYITQV